MLHFYLQSKWICVYICLCELICIHSNRRIAPRIVLNLYPTVVIYFHKLATTDWARLKETEYLRGVWSRIDDEISNLKSWCACCKDCYRGNLKLYTISLNVNFVANSITDMLYDNRTCSLGNTCICTRRFRVYKWHSINDTYGSSDNNRAYVLNCT